MHDFHVAVNFSEPAKSRKWFCTLCLFNEIVTLMEVRLNKMEMTVSICRFYDLLSFFFFYRSQFSHHHPRPVFMDQGNAQGVETNSGKNSVRSLKIIHLLTVGGALCSSQLFLVILNVYVCISTRKPICRLTYVPGISVSFVYSSLAFSHFLKVCTCSQCWFLCAAVWII